MAKSTKPLKSLILAHEVIMNKIYLIRQQKVMLDKDLAILYEVPTRRLNEQVKRNIYRFPKDFMFQLTKRELENLKSQNATASWGGRRTLPYVFTEHGVLMLSSVLNSEKAIKVNIQIMRIYIKMRELLITNKDILLQLKELERMVATHDTDIKLIFEYLKQLVNPPQEPRTRIGYKRRDELA